MPGLSPMLTAEKTQQKELMQSNLAEVDVDSEVLKNYLPKRKPPVADFAQRYAKDPQCKRATTKQLERVVETDVTSTLLNAVFGALQRAVCKSRENPISRKGRE
ncbi:hypothetical protein K505DRAFT_340679 [Melanomma pulvis-pyrius CBS 109.77]|uniref:Uncharacterized protein n=1 Tax=Melanomma pulvis-pyrius CBS 109.77 TaxID=1314802 RepID=A0A6A6X1B8_9PLEO|nr:hypothetical protein K505DRAFT_340679 [Melanomma pulvis-pyrius CBS 109.77]